MTPPRCLRARLAAFALGLSPLVAPAQEGLATVDISPSGRQVDAVALHPLQSNRLMILERGQVLVSRDAGRTWTASSLPQVLAERVFIHRGRPGVVYLQEQSRRLLATFGATLIGGRTFSSNDFGDTWTQVTDGFHEVGYLALSVFASDPQEPQHLFATGRTHFSCAIGCGVGSIAPVDVALRESRDGGLTWSEPLRGLPALGRSGMTRIDGPMPPAPGRLFFGDSDVGVYVSTDGAKGWSVFPTPPLERFQWVEQDPFRAEVLYGYGINGYRRSDDGGATWRPVWGASSPYFRWLVVDATWKDRLWLYGVDGIKLSDDGGLTWVDLGLAADPSPPGIVSPGPSVTAFAPSPTDSSTAYAIRGGRLYRLAVPSRSRVAVEYQYGDRFWITGDSAEAASQDYRSGEALRTSQRFGLWSAADAPSGAVGVCRFQGNPAHGQSSRFLTLKGAECAALRGDPGWVLEGEDESFAMPAGRDGGCAAGTVAVTRFVNGWRNANHRYVVDAGVAKAMRESGWIEEGVAFCARPLGSNE